MFLRTHILKWTRSLVGDDELDARLRSLQTVVGYRHFKNGISHMKQWCGRDDRELQRVLLAVVAGAPRFTPKVMQNVRAILDFLYLAQYESHSDETIEYLSQALSTFHATKDVYISAGVRVGMHGNVIHHFNIPKLAGLHSFVSHVKEMGPASQYSTEISEYNHQPMAKHPYQASNRRNFFEQMCRYLDRRERIMYFDEFHTWLAAKSHIDTAELALQNYSPGFHSVMVPRIITSEDGKLTLPPGDLDRLRLCLTRKPSISRKELVSVAHTYELPNLLRDVAQYLASFPSANGRAQGVSVNYVDTWNKLRIFLPAVHDNKKDGIAHSVEALPPSPGRSFGHCHCVLVHDTDEAQETGIAGKLSPVISCSCSNVLNFPMTTGYRVAQVRLLFRPYLDDTSHPAHNRPLAYVQWFSRPKPAAEKDICMYVVSREDRPGRSRRGDVIDMTSIARFVQLIPKFGSVASNHLTTENTMELCRDFWINSFADKEIYQSVW
jgi:hypothetical protein